MIDVSLDTVIFGGGIAGLWTLNKLHNEGRQVILLESQAIGAGQTGMSQGIVHGGMKYALTGKLSEASQAIAPPRSAVLSAKVELEMLVGSKIIVATYSKRDMDTRSLQVKSVSASKYYGNMAEYFAGRTWDFKDDPDEFIQAMSKNLS